MDPFLPIGQYPYSHWVLGAHPGGIESYRVFPQLGVLPCDRGNMSGSHWLLRFVTAAPLKWAQPDMTPEAPNTASASKNLDEEVFLHILNSFAANRLMNMEPDLSLLLSLITTKDNRLVMLTADQAEELLKLDPLIKDTLCITWQNDSYENLLQLGMFPI